MYDVVGGKPTGCPGTEIPRKEGAERHEKEKGESEKSSMRNDELLVRKEREGDRCWCWCR